MTNLEILMEIAENPKECDIDISEDKMLVLELLIMEVFAAKCAGGLHMVHTSKNSVH